MPFDAAVRRLESKTPVATRLNTAELQQLGVGVLDRAFFSARVDDIRTVAQMQAKIGEALSLARQPGGPFMGRDRFINDMRAILGATPGDSGALTDLTSAKRLGLIYDFNVEDAREYGRWLASQSLAIRDAFPCNELVRVEHREVPRGYKKGPSGKLIAVPEESWPVRWQNHGGQFYDGRMIALKDDPIWVAISRFGRPWPPFDFMSGMGLADISRDDAVALGVIGPDAPPPAAQAMDFNKNLEASVPEAEPAVLEGLKELFGEQVDVNPRNGKIIWQGQRVAKLYEAALADPEVKWTVPLGVVTDQARSLAAAAGVKLRPDAVLNLDADHIRKVFKDHGPTEPRGDQRPLTPLDFQLIPHVWRAPDAVEPGDTPGDLVFRRKLLGELVVVTWRPAPKSGAVRLQTMYVKKEGGTP